MKDAKGLPTGEYRYEGAVANRALELLGRGIGMFLERHEHGGPGDFDRMSDVSCARWRAGQLVRLEERRAYGLRDEGYPRLKILTCSLPEL